MVPADNGPEMSVMTRGILNKVRHMVPPMLDKFHKGTAAHPMAATRRIPSNTKMLMPPQGNSEE
ncbi:ATP-dependent (S)-NAD(P)H-hydrate dehydratase [Metarhizium anisopliae]|nr:ATP-dependent (S)-NAD(P)H-hydrate dehydratase [Metarhizium anisopliae]